MQFDYLVFIGRFQPFHQGHQYVIRQALQHAKQVIVLVGSANSPRTLSNPFDFFERCSMILGSFTTDDASRIICVPLADAIYNDNRWLLDAQRCIMDNTDDGANIAIIGHDKDESSYYLGLFPQYGSFLVENFENLSATPLRHAYFGDDDAARDRAYARMTDASRQFLQAFMQTADYAVLKQQLGEIQRYQAAWQHAPYPPIFTTTDALIVQSGHILLIERGGDYGQGLYALPGGFVDPHENLLSACLREVHEETNLPIDAQTLTSHLKASQTFDAPKRSQRGRTITTVYYFQLPATTQLPVLTAGDDAKHAFWLPLAKLDGRQMFEDHYSIICKMLGI